MILFVRQYFQVHFCMRSIPFREIQQTLVEIGDKEPSFVGSCEWIGAIELSFVLDKLLGVSTRFNIHVLLLLMH